MPGSYNLGTAAGRIIVDGSGAEKGFGVASAAAQGFYKVLSDKINTVKNVGKGLLGIGSAGAAGIGLAIKAASNFQTELSAVQAVSGATTDEMKKISKAALRIGKDTTFSASEAAQAMEELVKAGVSVNDVLNGAADAVVALAAAGQIDLPRAAEVASNAMNNFKLKGSDMPHVADLIAGAANASAISVDDFAYSLSQGGAVAAISGLKFDDLAVAIAEMGNAGIKGSDAGTSIKTFLTNLIPTTESQINKFVELGLIMGGNATAMQQLAKRGIRPLSNSYADINDAIMKYVVRTTGLKSGSAKAQKEVNKLGQITGALKNQFFDANGNIKSMADIQGVLNKSTKNLTKEQKLQTLEMLFGSDAIRAAAVLADQGAAGYNKMAAAMGKVKAADVAKTRMDNLKGSIEQLRGSFETMLITIGNIFLPMVKKVVDAVTWLVNLFNSLPEPIQKTIGIILGLVTAFSLITGAIITLAFALAPIILQFLAMRALKSVFSIFVDGFKAFRGGATAVEAVTVGLRRGVEVFTKFGRIGRVLFGVLTRIPGILGAIRTAISFVFGPWGALIAIVIAAVIILYNKWKPFHDLVNNTAQMVKNGLVVAFNFLKAAWDQIVAGFSGASSSVGGVAGFFITLGQAAKTVWDALVLLGQAFMDNVVPALKAVGGNLLTALISGWNQIKDAVVTNLLPALQQLGQTFMTQILPALKQVWAVLGPFLAVVGKVAAVIVGVLLYALFQWYKFLITYVLPALITVIGWILGKLIPVIAGLIVIVINVISWFFKFAAAVITAVVGAIKAVVDWFTRFATATKNIVVASFDFIKNAIKTAVDFIRNVITTGLNIIKSIWQAVWGLFGPLVMAIFGLISAVVKLGMAIVMFVINTALAAIKAIWSAVWNFLVAVVTAVWGFIWGVIMFYVNLIKAAINIALEFIKAIWNAAWTWISGIVTTVWTAIVNAVSGPINWIKGLISSALGAIRGFFQTHFGGAKTDTINAFDGIKKAISDKIEAAKKFVSDAIATIKGYFAGAGSWLYNAGRNIIQGLIDGVTSMITSLTNKLSSLTKLIPDKKGPPAVDKRLLQRNGQLIIQGLINGISDEEGNLINKLQSLSTAIPVTMDASSSVAMAGVGAGRVTPAAQTAATGLKMVNGTLGIDPSGKAWIQGLAQEVVDTGEDYGTTLSRMGGF